MNELSILERHQEYLGAFSFTEFNKKRGYITKYLVDPNLSFLNEDDVLFFNKLIDIHQKSYFDYINSWSIVNLQSPTFYLSKYFDWLDEKHINAFIIVLFTKHEFLARELFPLLSTKNKILFINEAYNYPEIIKLIPKVKNYMVFL